MHNKPVTQFSGHELSALPATEVVALLQQREISASELVDVSLGRIEAVGSAINATPTVCPERAKAAAKQLDNAPAQTTFNFLAGLPVSIKDLSAVAGVRSTWGTVGLKDHVPTQSDYFVERIEQRGGVVMGKTNTPEFGAGGNTFNDVFGMTRNPWDIRKNAGGSSGGATASLAAGEVWLSQGSDLGGSLRTPAAYCGVVGLRPSPGVIAKGPGGNSFETGGVVGPMARNVLDCALFLDVMSGYDERSPISWPAPDTSYQQAVHQAKEKVRIAYSRDWHGFTVVSDDIDRILREALVKVEAQGGLVDETFPHLPNLDFAYRVHRSMTMAGGPGRAAPAIQQHFKATLRGNIEQGRQLSIDDLYDANIYQTAIFQNVQPYFTNYDVLACPVVGLHPGPVEEEYPSHVDGQPLGDYIEWLKFSFLSTLLGLPSMSVPVGFSADGMPVGIQLIGPPRGEAKLLAVAKAVEQAVGGPLGPIDPM